MLSTRICNGRLWKKRSPQGGNLSRIAKIRSLQSRPGIGIRKGHGARQAAKDISLALRPQPKPFATPMDMGCRAGGPRATTAPTTLDFPVLRMGIWIRFGKV